jgi:hypothetical protein
MFRNRYLLGVADRPGAELGERVGGILSATVEGVATATAAAGGAAAEETIGRFYGGFYTIVNTLSLVLQLFVVSRVIKYGGPRIALAVLPVIALGGYAFMAFLPILAAIRWAKVAENATDYSLNNTARNVLFLPTTREQKYAAKQAIDSFFKVAGRCGSARMLVRPALPAAGGQRAVGPAAAPQLLEVQRDRLAAAQQVLHDLRGRAADGVRRAAVLEVGPEAGTDRLGQRRFEVLERGAAEHRVAGVQRPERDRQVLPRQHQREQREHVLQAAARPFAQHLVHQG